MSNEEVDISLRDHGETEGSFKILKEVSDNLDPKADNVVYFLESVSMDGEFQSLLDKANKGEMSYREAFVRYNIPDYDSLYSTYPLLNSVSRRKWGDQMVSIFKLLDFYAYNPDASFKTFELLNNQKSNAEKNGIFLLNRASEFDSLKEILRRKGKNLIVITENDEEVVDLLQSNEVLNAEFEDKELYDLDYSILKNLKGSIVLSTLALLRDERNAKRLREQVQKLSGRTQIFSHFGSQHKLMPTFLKIEGFNAHVIVEKDIYPQFYNIIDWDIYNFIQERGTNSLDILKDKEIFNELSNRLFEKHKADLFIMEFVEKKVMSGKLKDKTDYYNQIKEYLKEYSNEEVVRIVREWFSGYPKS